MAEERVQRRLAAILAADVVGYSRLIRADEEGTLARLRMLREQVIDPSFARHGGRIVKLMGDGMLAEFPSVVDAVRNAVEVQEAVAKNQASLPEDRRIVFRVGVNLGDVVIDGDDIHGDGVNLAARLEALADPGGVCISGAVYEQVRDRIDLAFQNLGKREVKNIERPIRLWQWNRVAPDGEAASDDLPPLPDKPSIAVLPFDNMSDNREYQYLADGLAEDIITLLARVPGFFVIARNSAFSYKGGQHDIRQVGRELGVRYVVEGSLRPVGRRIRITVQLIDAATGNHIWAEQFNRTADEIYEIQDDVTSGIVTRLEPEITRAEVELIKRRPPADLDAWALYQKASGTLALKGWHEETFAEAADLYRKAISLDPEFALAHATLSLLLSVGHLVGHLSEPDEALAEAERALQLEGDRSDVLGYAGCALSDLGHTTRGIELLERAIERDPSNAQAWVALGGSLLAIRRFDDAVEKLEHGLRISPRDNRLAVWGGLFAIALDRQGRREEAIEQARLACRRDDKLHNPRLVLAMLLMEAGRADEAAAALNEAYRIRPGLSTREIQGLIGHKGAAIVETIPKA